MLHVPALPVPQQDCPDPPQLDEQTLPVAEIRQLQAVYERVIARYFETFA